MIVVLLEEVKEAMAGAQHPAGAPEEDGATGAAGLLSARGVRRQGIEVIL